MCLHNRIDVSIGEVNAFKIFGIDYEGNLRSAFNASLKKGLTYPSNQRIKVDDESATFFAFANQSDAISVVRGGKSIWDFSYPTLIVLPVTLFDVVAQGNLHLPSGDPQCLDGYYKSFESKEILVHDGRPL